ncbi:cyclic nucleotide-binding domain-containing protein [Candidatus Puniceispirillum sp.]|nr:cyclic nucleotide-binding domain-containing protein [Alphaproteobacteria bacterium]MDC1293803.1 cyclic nucleotide-binding domain-containing protein [Candidatus Puniceispirillum sp.]
MSKEEILNLLPGDYIFREGEFGQHAYIINSGTVELVKFTGDQQSVLAELEKGALFGEMAIIDSSARSASARAKTECVLKVVSEEQLKKHLSSSPTASLDMMRRLASYVRNANERLNRDAFAEVPETNSTSNNSSDKLDDVDVYTKKILREFNDDLDEFAKISPKKPLAVAGMVIIAMVLSFGVWASFAEIDVTVSTRGKILTSIPNVEVQSNHSSVVKTILVKEGDNVVKGQALAEFDETLIASDFRNTKDELAATNKDITRTKAELNFILDKEFEAPAGELQLAVFEGQVSEIQMQKLDHEAKISGLEVKLDRAILKSEILRDELRKAVRPDIKTKRQRLNVKRQLLAFLQNKPYSFNENSPALEYFNSKTAEIQTSLSDLKGQMTLSQKEVDRSKGLLAAKILPKAEHEKKVHDLEKAKINFDKYLTSQIASTFEEIQSLTTELNSLEQRERKLVSDIKNTDIDRKENSLDLMKANLEHEKFISGKLNEKNSTLKDLTLKQQSLKEKVIKLTRQVEDVKLTSPIDGTVLKLEDQFEGTVIKPGDIIATLVPNDLNFHVEVDIDPADITHVYEGATVKVMLDALPSQKHGELLGTVTLLSKDTVDEDVFGEKNSVYRAEIEIVENNLVELPEGFKLMPSMSVAGNIKSGKRTVMTFLMFPVIKTLETSFREP